MCGFLDMDIPLILEENQAWEENKDRNGTFLFQH